MTKFRSLFFQDQRLNRKVNIIRAIMLILFFGMMWAALITIKNDDSLYADEVKSNLESFAYMVSIYAAFISATTGLALGDSIKRDIMSGWLRYSYALPITPSDRAKTIIARNINTSAVSMLFCTLNIIGFCKLAGLRFTCGFIIVELACLIMFEIMEIILNYFTFSARNMDDYKKMYNRSGFVTVGISVLFAVIAYRVLKNKIHINMENGVPDLSLITEISAVHLLRLIPLTAAFFVLDYFVICSRLSRAYGTGAVSGHRSAERAENAETISFSGDYPKGFLYKEIRQNVLNIFLSALLPLFLRIFVFIMVAFASISGDDENISIMDATGRLATILLIVSGVFLISNIISGVFLGDDKKLWAFFTVSTPAGVKGFMYYKYVMCFALNGIYMVSWIFFNSISDTMRYAVIGEEVSPATGTILIVFFVLLLLSAFDIPFIVRYGAKKGSIIKVSAMLSLSLIATIIFAMLPSETEDKLLGFISGIYNGEATDTVYLISSLFPPAALAAYYASYRISCRLFMKGVNEYVK